MFHTSTLMNISIYVTNQQMHTDKVCFIIYYVIYNVSYITQKLLKHIGEFNIY